MASPTAAGPRIILATSNGAGTGHLARQVATALALSGRAEPIFLSMSLAMPAVFNLGMHGEYCPSYQREAMPRLLWDRYLADRIRALVAETKANVVVFDGVAPYRGLLRARVRLPDVAFVWVRRPLWQPGVNTRSLRAARFFDLVIEPGDLAAPADRGPTTTVNDVRRISPVTLTEQVRRLPRQEAATRLGLDPSMPTALVTLRGDPFAAEGAAAAAVRELLANPEWQVALARRPNTTQPISGTATGGRRIVVLPEVFPLVRYLSAFDIAVSEAGYNSVHELLLTGIPAVLVPAAGVLTDDQEARAGWAAGHGLALQAALQDSEAIAAAVKQLTDPVLRAEIARRSASLLSPRGAVEAADALITLGEQFRRHRLSLGELRELGLGLARSTSKSLLGRLRTALRAALGRSTDRGPASKLRVRLTDQLDQLQPGAAGVDRMPLLFTEKISSVDLTSGSPIEHVLAGSSEGYRLERERIARRYYAIET